MARCYPFECPRCNYQARVAGHEDSGYDWFSRTIHCRDCRELFDAITSIRTNLIEGCGATPTSLSGDELRSIKARVACRPSLWNRFGLFKSFARPDWLRLEVACPNNPRHRIEPWFEPGRCPRCNNYLERTLMPSLVRD